MIFLMFVHKYGQPFKDSEILINMYCHLNKNKK